MNFRQDILAPVTAIGDRAVGVGLRPDHYQQALEEEIPTDFLEVHSENFFSEHGLLIELLQDISAKTPISLHGTAAGLGSDVGVPDEYLKKLKRVVDRVNPVLVSDHLCFTWGRVNGETLHGGDLLPIPYTDESLRCAVDNINRVQSHLGRRIAVENVCAYLEFDQGEFDEVSFLNEIVARTGCGIILDINNLMVNARNARLGDPDSHVESYVRSIDQEAVMEIHLAGSTPVTEDGLLIDDHACPVSDAGWRHYRMTLEQIGPRPTLIEWDTNLPPWPRLLAEAAIARGIQQPSRQRTRRHEPA